MLDLAIIVPTRGRPENIRKVISAWDFTNAWDVANLVLAVDADDHEYQGYLDLFEEHRHPDTEEQLFSMVTMGQWMPMVHKLNNVAESLALSRKYFALGFAGDDHLPQTIGWAQRYLTILRELGTGMVYGDDGYQGRKLSTEWAVTSDAVRALDRMVPADVEHMYCDNAMMDLYRSAGALRHLPEVRIEHMHPYAGKAENDEQYKRVNHRDQFAKDRRAYESWRHGGVFLKDVAEIRHLRKGRPDVTTEPTPIRPRVAGSGPRRVERRPQRSGPSAARRSRSEDRSSRVPRQFQDVQAATPDDVMMALADFAAQVPTDQEIVELGVFQGRTALQMAWGASQGYGAHVTAIDVWDLPGNVYSPPFTDAETRLKAFNWVNSLGYASQITLIQGFSHEVAEEWTGQTKPVGLLYVDGDHTRDGARRDIVSWAPHLAPGAVIAVDDYGHVDWPGVGQALDELVAEGVLEPLEIFHDRLAVTRLTENWQTHLMTPALGIVKAVTSEGVYPDRAVLEAEWDRVDPDGVATLRESAAKLDSERSNLFVHVGELEAVEVGTPIENLNTYQLRALAKVRGIALGARKDKRSEMIQALTEGR